MLDKATVVEVKDLQPEAIQELSPMESTQPLTDLQQILSFLHENHLSSTEIREMKDLLETLPEMIQDLPEMIEERTKALLKPAEGKSEMFQITKQNQEIAQEQLKIAQNNTEILLRNLELHEESVAATKQQTQLLEENKKEVLHLTSLVKQLVACQPSQMPSSKSGSNGN